MALIGNASLLHKSPCQYVTGTVGFCDRANWNKPGAMRNRGDLTLSTLWKYDAVPSGMMAGRAFLAPQTAGRIVTRSAFGISGQVVGAMGVPGSASGTMAINAESVGGLIAGGVATCTMSITGSAAIAGLAAGSASGTMTVNGSAVIGATAWGVASGTMTINGEAIAYGRGYMQASTVDNSVLSPKTIAAEVWNTLAASFTVAGTMGNAVNSSASGGVDYTALGNAVRGELSPELDQITKVSKLHGIGADLIVTPTSRTAGSLVQIISTAGDAVTVSAA